MIPSNTPVRTRREAATLGLKKFWPGVKCRHGHEAMRYTRNGMCCACMARQRQTFMLTDPDGRVTLALKTYPQLREAIAAHAAALEMALEWECPPGVPMVEWLKSRKN